MIVIIESFPVIPLVQPYSMKAVREIVIPLLVKGSSGGIFLSAC